jgi:hypothetical protein
MTQDEIKQLSPLERMAYWIEEREAIRLKREAGESKPWTQDPILLGYRFCNVRRMDDRVSRWLLENWYQPYLDHPSMLVNVALARFINNPPILQEIGFQEEWAPALLKALLRLLSESRTIWNAAYMVRGHTKAQYSGDKIGAVIDIYCTPLVVDPPLIYPFSMSRTWESLQGRYGFGSFMAGQVVADLRWAMTGTWADRHTWAPAGPGSLRGLNRVLGQHSKSKINPTYWGHWFGWYMDKIKPLLPSSITDRLEAMDYQNCLCEWDKMERCLWGEGRPKQTYPGRQ